MSDEQSSNDKPVPPIVRRRVARSANTAAEVGTTAPSEQASSVDASAAPRAAATRDSGSADPSASSAAAGPATESAASPARTGERAAGDQVTYDMRAARGPRPPRASGGPGGARGPRPEGSRGPRPEGARGPRPEGARGPRRDGDDARRPGASGGRAMPSMPYRGSVDRASADFVDQWLSRPQPKPVPPPERTERPREERRPRRDDARPAQAQARPARIAAEPKPAPKMPTLHETILVGLPKVAVEAQRDKSANKPKTAKEAMRLKAGQAKGKSAEETRAEASTLEESVVVDPAWVTVGADGAVAAITASGAAAEALIDAWIDALNAAAIVEAAASDALSGSTRKAAKRALNVLKSRKIALPEPTARAVSARTESDEVLEATFTPPDGRGAVSITISKRRGGERAHIAEVILRDQLGIVQAVSGWMSRSQIREAHQRITDSTGVAPAPVPVEWARHRIAQAIAANARSGQLVPLSFERCRELVEPAPSSDPPHPLADLESALRDGDEVGAATGGLHAEPELRGWVPDSRALDEMLRKVGERLKADDAQDSAKVDEALREEMKAATDRFFSPEMRAEIARRMRDAAITIRSRAGDARAREVLLAARAVEKAGLITSPPSELEFLRAFFQKGVALLAQQGGGQLRVPVQNATA
jgi:hypothetical protein